MKKQITFTIYGNQENGKGNPIPYLRSTQASQFSPQAKRYNAWKDFVRASYFDAVNPKTVIKREDFGRMHDMLQKKPITETVKARVSTFIHFGNETHADPDNVAKGILDALFKNDKHVDVHTDHVCGASQPGVKVTIDFE